MLNSSSATTGSAKMYSPSQNNLDLMEASAMGQAKVEVLVELVAAQDEEKVLV